MKCVTCTVEQTGRSETTSMCLLLPLQMCPCALLFSFYHQIILIQYSFGVRLLSLTYCCEVMSPWHEGRNSLGSSCRSVYRLTCGSRGNLDGDGLAAERLPLSNYMAASMEGELLLHDPFMVPNIPFLFILNLFVQSSPLMLAAPSSPRHWERGKRHTRRL